MSDIWVTLESDDYYFVRTRVDYTIKAKREPLALNWLMLAAINRNGFAGEIVEVGEVISGESTSIVCATPPPPE